MVQLYCCQGQTHSWSYLEFPFKIKLTIEGGILRSEHHGRRRSNRFINSSPLNKMDEIFVLAEFGM